MAEQHPADELCFFCASDDILLAGITQIDAGKPYRGPTVHMQVPEAFCPHMDPIDPVSTGDGAL